MAKVTGPLASFSATGKIGKTLVFFSHLGRNVVRSLVTPANPQTETQGDQRLLLGALGKASKAVAKTSAYLTDVKTVTPSGQTWVSAFVKGAIDLYGSGDTGVSALKDALDDHDQSALFESEGLAKGLATVTIPYATEPGTLNPGEQLFALAAYSMSLKGAYPEILDRDPYTTALSSWSSANVAAFSADIGAV